MMKILMKIFLFYLRNLPGHPCGQRDPYLENCTWKRPRIDNVVTAARDKAGKS
jgi:hypothetical protein